MRQGKVQGLYYVFALVPLVFANHLWSRPDLGALRALEMTLYLVPTFAFVLGMCAMVLVTVLTEANAFLRRHLTETVEPLTMKEHPISILG